VVRNRTRDDRLVAGYVEVRVRRTATFAALYIWVTHDARLVGELPPAGAVRQARIRFSIGIGVYTGAFALAWVSPPVALAAHAAMALYYAFDQASVAAPVTPPAP
jgi:hypothetical protein